MELREGKQKITATAQAHGGEDRVKKGEVLTTPVKPRPRTRSFWPAPF